MEKIKKGLPRRASNAHQKDARHARWLAGQSRKRERQAANEAAHKANLALTAAGERTPWERANGHDPGEQARRHAARPEHHRRRRMEKAGHAH